MYKALTNFSGLISATKNEILEIKDELIIKDLIKAGYIEEIKKTSKEPALKELKKEVNLKP